MRSRLPHKRDRKPRIEHEHIEAVRLMELVRMHENRWPALQRLFHVPNGGLRSKAAAGKLKAEGVRPGVSDYLLPHRASVLGREYTGLAMELKAEGGIVTPEQKDWLSFFDSQGWKACVVVGFERAWEVVREYARGCDQ